MRILEFFQDSDRLYSCYRLMFIVSTIGLFVLAFLQFFGLGEIPIALYGILGTMGSGGYIGGKYIDSRCEQAAVEEQADTPIE